MSPVPDQRWALIVNRPSEDASARLAAELAGILRSRNRSADFMLRRSGESPEALARAALSRGAQTVVAVGGDGTVSAVAEALAGSDNVLGIIPAGTLNHFARDLRIPLEPEAAVQVIEGGHTIRVDVAEVNGRIFINNSSIGLYPKLVGERAALQAGGWSKWPALAWATAKVLARYARVNVELKAASAVRSCTTPLVMVANNEYSIRGLSLGTREQLDGGVLGIYIVRDTGRLGFALLCWRALLGHLRPGDELEFLRCVELEIRRRKGQIRVALDGEVERLTSPLRYKIRHADLVVAAPAATKQMPPAHNLPDRDFFRVDLSG